MSSSAVAAPREPHVCVSTVRFVLDLANVSGGDIPHWCEAVGLDPACLDQPDVRVPRWQLMQLVHRVERQVDAERAFRAYERVNPGVFHTVGFAMMTSATLLQALERLVRFSSLLDSGARLQIAAEGEDFRLTMARDDDLPIPRFLCDVGLASLMGFLRFLAGGARVAGQGTGVDA